jgi:hypothetical protein
MDISDAKPRAQGASRREHYDDDPTQNRTRAASAAFPASEESMSICRKKVHGVTEDGSLTVNTRQKCFERLDQDSRLKILGYLTLDELAESSMVSRLFRDDCRHTSLSQVRTAVIRFKDDSLSSGSFPARLCRRLGALARTGARQGKFERFTRVKIEESHRLVIEYFSEYSETPVVPIPEVTSLALPWEGGLRLTFGQQNERNRRELNCHLAFRYLAAALPNIRELVLSGWNYGYKGYDDSHILSDVAAWFESLERLVWPGSPALEIEGISLRCCRNLRDLNIDGACLRSIGFEEYTRSTLEGEGNHAFLLRGANTPLALERVSIKGAKYKRKGQQIEPEPISIPQQWLIKFARRAASLRWLRSDLTPENVAMLKRERPDVEFVS